MTSVKMDTIYDYDERYRESETDATLTWVPEKFGTRRIGLAIIGVGRMGAIHMYNCIREPRANTLYVVDASQERLDYMKKKYFLDDRGIKTIHTDQWDVVMKDKRVEALLISTPTFTHEKYIRDGLENGKNIICEKPLAESVDKIKKLVALARSKNLKLICAFQRHFDRTIRKVVDQIHRGDIGAPRMIKSCYRDSPMPNIEFIKTSSGAFQDIGIHCVEESIWIARELPTEIYAVGQAFDKAYEEINDFDTIAWTMKFPSGIIAMSDVSRISATGYETRLEVYGEKGVLKIDEYPESHWEKHTDIGMTKPNQCYSFASRFKEAYAAELIDFFNHIEGNKVLEPIIDNYLPALSKVIAALDKSARSRSTVTLTWSESEKCF